MKSKFAAMSLLLLICLTCAAGTWSPTQQYIWNFASGHAFMTQCAIRGYARMEPIADLGALYRQMLTAAAYDEWTKVTQRSLHEKRIYSISKNRWVPYTINAEDCKDTDRAAEMFILRIRAGQTDQLSK